MQNKTLHSYTLASGQQVDGYVHDLAHLSAKFQVWARTLDIDDETSLAVWVSSQPEKHSIFFKNTAYVFRLAAIGFEKLEGATIPVLK